MVFARDLENCRERGGVCVYPVPYAVRNLLPHVRALLIGVEIFIRSTNMLVNQDDAYVMAVVGEAVEGRLDGRGLRLAIYY